MATLSVRIAQPPTRMVPGFDTLGDCVVVNEVLGEATEPFYFAETRDLGTATVQPEGAEAFPFKPLVDGTTSINHLAFTAAVDVGTPVTFAWTGGADVPAGEITVTALPHPGAVTTSPFVAGEPLHISWETAIGETLLQFQAADDRVITCTVDDTDLTVAGELTALMDTSEWADNPFDESLAMFAPTVTSAVATGVEARGLAYWVLPLDLL